MFVSSQNYFYSLFRLHSVISVSRLGKLFTYGLFATTATAGVAGYSLATGQLPAINNAALGVAAAAFNTIQNQYNVDFDNAWGSFQKYTHASLENRSSSSF